VSIKKLLLSAEKMPLIGSKNLPSVWLELLAMEGA